MRRSSRVLLAVVAVGGLVLGAAVPAAAATVDRGVEAEFLRLHDGSRADAGLAPLAEDPAATAVARDWASTLAESGELRHNPDLVAQVDGRVSDRWTRLGENVGRGPNAASIHDAFLASASHRANVLGRYDRVGIGVVRDDSGEVWVVVVFLEVPPAPPAPTSQWAPFASPEAFVEQQYRDFLGRPGDAVGVGYWAGAVRDGQASTAGVAAALLHSDEFEGVLAPVVRLFLAHAAGPPPPAALDAALIRRRAGASLDDIAADLVGNGAGDLVAASSTPEFRWTSVSEVLVTMAYVGMLHRAPEAAGYEYWLGHLDAGRPLATLLGGILASPEYVARF